MSASIKSERYLIVKRVLSLLCDVRPKNPEEFVAETVFTIEKNLVSRERALAQYPTVDIRRSLKRAIERQPQLSELNEDQRVVAADLFKSLSAEKDSQIPQTILRDHFFVLTEGEMEVVRGKYVIRIVRTGDDFGTLTGRIYISDDTNVCAREKSIVWFISKNTLSHIVADHTTWRRTKYIESLTIPFSLKERYCGKEITRVLCPFADPTKPENYSCACCTITGRFFNKPKHYYPLIDGIPANMFGPNNILPEPPLLRAIDRVRFADGHYVLRQGQDSTRFYYIIEGEATVYFAFDGCMEKEIGVLKATDCFGEMGMLYNSKAPSTIKAKSNLLCMRFQPMVYEECLNHYFDEPVQSQDADESEDPMHTSKETNTYK